MRVTVFGANGNTGREIIKSLLSRGDTVTAAVRRPDSLTPQTRLSIRPVDIYNCKSVEAAITNSNVVISALGNGGIMSTKQGMTLYSDFARTVRSAMRNQGLKRLIVCSSGGVQEDDKAPWVYTTLIRRVVMNMYMDMMKMETILEESPDIDWTSVRLTFLRPNSEEKRVVLANNRVLGGGCYKISNEDAGKFIAEEAHEGKWIRKYPVLGYAL